MLSEGINDLAGPQDLPRAADKLVGALQSLILHKRGKRKGGHKANRESYLPQSASPSLMYDAVKDCEAVGQARPLRPHDCAPAAALARGR
jgi:hypothetical protein